MAKITPILDVLDLDEDAAAVERLRDSIATKIPPPSPESNQKATAEVSCFNFFLFQQPTSCVFAVWCIAGRGDHDAAGTRRGPALSEIRP